MLVLFETPAGYAVFKVLDESKLEKPEKIWDAFSSPTGTQRCLELIEFKKFKNVADALKMSTGVEEGKISKSLKKLLKSIVAESEELAVDDNKLGALIKDNLNIQCVHGRVTDELFRAIRSSVDDVLAQHKNEIDSMRLALAHSLGRYRVKFNPEKIDTMIVQAVSLLDDLDKEINNYAMRCREWYGWHFPELGKVIQDHLVYAKVVKAIGMKQNTESIDLSAILPEELSARVKEEAELSMGTDISELDIIHITQLCDQIIELMQYRSHLSEYLKDRMNTLAPNLTALIGELLGARLISRAGTLMSLAKYPASTIQILGAEKALFRALKVKRQTPKYGLLYHAQLVGSVGTQSKGRMARKLSAKVALATRIDSLSDEAVGNEMGVEALAYLQGVAKVESARGPKRASNAERKSGFKFKSEVHTYGTAPPKKMFKGE